ncbi:molybdopterin-synthase adenylyltransferase MoeB [Phototrophicus methaneseepsis]|uniref:Molybdopterin-synthase adenylyltransferase MoeB n=1 Tax=Phototrophicus methaneseepsis TaxID=2710758 RepID=A0A7S8EDR2_9CHLR|nr:molybdopterin-synthase adenylyltransferase MoeB [Phototrophicus methaneseepsis]QPC85074.1 molybdopterin-synthase adenylyltransferase MoeB [Phototrophicus methaneseepsis]
MQALIERQAELSHEEISRYSRHIIMPEVGIEGQRKLKAASVLLIGTGGLGSPTALYLAAAGIGRMGLVDYDVVDESNLQRQVIHGTSTVGVRKVDSAEKRLLDLNPDIQIDKHNVPLTSENALELFAPYDVIIDGTDNFPTRYLVNDACVKLGKPNVYGSIFRFEGQLSVFYAEEGPCYRCMFPEPPPPGLVPSCAEGGVLGILPGTIGTMQATEAIKLILGIGEPMIGRMLLYDALNMEFNTIKVRKDPHCPVCGVPADEVELIDYEQFCGMPAHDHSSFSLADEEEYEGMQEISVSDLKARIDAGDDIVVLDVRDPHEWEIAAIDGTLRIPKGDIQAAKNAVIAGRKLPEETVLAQIPRDKTLMVHCRSGKRSADSINFLREAGYDPNKMYNVLGGILAWADEIDPSLPKY